MKDYPYVPGWRLNKENNKPAIKHSVLMLTKHGIAEGEWEGNEWIQYRWSCKVKDSDVLYWMHLEDLTQLEKEGQSLHHEQSSLPDNLDEAEFEYAQSLDENPANQEEDKMIYDAFKAGAKWMAKQGESIESTVVTTQDEDTCRPYLALQNFGYMSAPTFCKEDDKVIVQIRKK